MWLAGRCSAARKRWSPHNSPFLNSVKPTFQNRLFFFWLGQRKEIQYLISVLFFLFHVIFGVCFGTLELFSLVWFAHGRVQNRRPWGQKPAASQVLGGGWLNCSGQCDRPFVRLLRGGEGGTRVKDGKVHGIPTWERCVRLFPFLLARNEPKCTVEIRLGFQKDGPGSE